MLTVSAPHPCITQLDLVHNTLMRMNDELKKIKCAHEIYL